MILNPSLGDQIMSTIIYIQVRILTWRSHDELSRLLDQVTNKSKVWTLSAENFLTRSAFQNLGIEKIEIETKKMWDVEP